MASVQQTQDPTLTVAAGLQDLSNLPMNAEIVSNNNIVGASNSRMSFIIPDAATSEELIIFSLNPQIVRRTKNVVESEFATMNAWHTYRWMEEPTLWELAGYAGTDGPRLRHYIMRLDGQDNVTWSYPYLMNTKYGFLGHSQNSGTPGGINVKIISTSMPYDATRGPYSEYYTIVMRELSTQVLNVTSDAYGIQRLAQVISAVGGTSLATATNARVFNLTPNFNDLNQIATFLFANHLTTIIPSTQVIFMQSANQLKYTAWSTDYPVNSLNGDQIYQLSYDGGSAHT